MRIENAQKSVYNRIIESANDPALPKQSSKKEGFQLMKRKNTLARFTRYSVSGPYNCVHVPDHRSRHFGCCPAQMAVRRAAVNCREQKGHTKCGNTL